MTVENFLFFAFAGAVLIVSAIYLVKSLKKIAFILKISGFSAAFILMAFATSLPELFIGISSSTQGVPQISLGNILGANIINLTLLTGLFILIGRGIKFRSENINHEIYFMFFSIILLIILYLIGNSLSRIDGIILLTFFIINTARLMRKRKKYSAKIKVKRKKNHKELIHILIFMVSLIALFLSSEYVVKYAEAIAVDLNLPEIFMGIFLVSIATVLPELVFGVGAVLLKQKIMSIGDQAGTIFTNICLVLGVVALISPVQIPLVSFLIPSIFMALCGFIFLYFIRSKRKLEIYEGIILIGLYLFFIFLQFSAIIF